MIWTNEVNNLLLFHMFFRSEPPSSPPPKWEWDRNMKLGCAIKKCGPYVDVLARDKRGCGEAKTCIRISFDSRKSRKVLSGRLSRPDVCAKLSRPRVPASSDSLHFQKDVDDDFHKSRHTKTNRVWASDRGLLPSSIVLHAHITRCAIEWIQICCSWPLIE